MARGSLPGRSVRPHPSRNRVSPATSMSSTRKHWLPGVWPGVCRVRISTAPTVITSPPSWATRSVAATSVVRLTHSASCRFTWTGTSTISSSRATPSMP